jgi:hypothetical protein
VNTRHSRDGFGRIVVDPKVEEVRYAELTFALRDYLALYSEDDARIEELRTDVLDTMSEGIEFLAAYDALVYRIKVMT